MELLEVKAVVEAVNRHWTTFCIDEKTAQSREFCIVIKSLAWCDVLRLLCLQRLDGKTDVPPI